MSVPTDNNISGKEYKKIRKYKDLAIETEKIWHLKTTTLSIIEGPLGRIKEGSDKNIKIPSTLSQYKRKKTHYRELLISLEEYCHCEEKNNTKKHEYIEYV